MARFARSAFIASALLVALAAQPTRGAITEVELSLARVEAISGSTAVLLRFEGELLDNALVQLDYPLYLVVWERATGNYVRFDVGSGAVSGSAPQLTDGVTSSEALGLLWEGAPVEDSRVAFVGAGRVDVLLPHGLVSGELDAAGFALYEGEVLVSNSVPVAGELR
jgi:hypothetical protein